MPSVFQKKRDVPSKGAGAALQLYAERSTGTSYA